MSIEKELIPYEEALALKELGFDQPCFAYWCADPSLSKPFLTFIKPFDDEWFIPTPLYSQAFRWFREKYDIQYWLNDGGCLGKAFIKITGFKHDKFYFSSSEPMEYEEAELACLKKLIEIVKNK